MEFIFALFTFITNAKQEAAMFLNGVGRRNTTEFCGKTFSKSTLQRPRKRWANNIKEDKARKLERKGKMNLTHYGVQSRALIPKVLNIWIRFP
jgi:hypothetical protein